MTKNIVFLKGRSLFTDGIVSNLSRFALLGRFHVIDLCQLDPMQQILKEQPDILVLDENDPEYSEKLKDKLFQSLPVIKIIFLDSKTTRIRVVQWCEHNIQQLSDLLDEIDSVGELTLNLTLQPKEFSGERPVNERTDV
jgi:hypothetical protein